MTADILQQIIDEIFAALEAAVASKPLLKIALEALHSIAVSLIPVILGKLQAKGIAK